jgi:hypothetical protein
VRLWVWSLPVPSPTKNYIPDKYYLPLERHRFIINFIGVFHFHQCKNWKSFKAIGRNGRTFVKSNNSILCTPSESYAPNHMVTYLLSASNLIRISFSSFENKELETTWHFFTLRFWTAPLLLFQSFYSLEIHMIGSQEVSACWKVRVQRGVRENRESTHLQCLLSSSSWEKFEAEKLNLCFL